MGSMYHCPYCSFQSNDVTDIDDHVYEDHDDSN